MNVSKLIQIATLTTLLIMSSFTRAQAPAANPDAADVNPKCGQPVFAKKDGTIRQFLVVNKVPVRTRQGDVPQIMEISFVVIVTRDVDGGSTLYPALCLPTSIQYTGNGMQIREGQQLGYEGTQATSISPVPQKP